MFTVLVVKRLLKNQAVELDEHLLEIAAEDRPNSVRGLYYMAMGAGLIDKDAQGKRNNYMRVQRRLLQMRRDGRMPRRDRFFRERSGWVMCHRKQELGSGGGFLRAPPDLLED